MNYDAAMFDTPTASLPRFFCVYNDKALADFSPGIPVIPWQNAGECDEPLKPVQPVTGPCLIDREEWEWNRDIHASYWLTLARNAGSERLIAYDPFGWDPAQLRTTGWWLRMKGWLGFGHAAAHMASRRALVPYLTDYAAWATDVYPPNGYDWAGYSEWALLKINAHVRVCVENRRIPVVLLHLDRDLTMQARLVKLADKRIRWGMWSDPATWEDVAVHAQAVRAFMGLVREGQVTT